MRLVVSRYYEIITDESAADGDAADRGEVYTDQYMSIREAVHEIKRNGFTEPSDSSVQAGTWLSTADADIDYQTGEHRYESLHFRREISRHEVTPGADRLSTHQTRRLFRAAGIKVR